MLMFRFEFFLEDKYVTDVLRALQGRAKNLNVNPVAEATVQRVGGGKVTAKTGNTLALIVEEIKKRKLDSFKASDMKEIIAKIGYNPSSHGHFIKELVKVGAIGKHGKGQHMTYTVRS